MKTITLDYDLYNKELAEAQKAGLRSGIYRACEYIKNKNTYMLIGEDNLRNRVDLDEALKSLNKGDE